VCNVKDANICQAMQQAQANGVDAWSNYQAKGTKLNIAEAALDSLRLQQKLSPPATPEGRALVERTIANYEEKIRHYESEKVQVTSQAEGFQAAHDRLNLHDDQFDMAEAATSIALFAVTVLTQKCRLLIVARVRGVRHRARDGRVPRPRPAPGLPRARSRLSAPTRDARPAARAPPTVVSKRGSSRRLECRRGPCRTSRSTGSRGAGRWGRRRCPA
jgi:hypothetical protein